MDVQVVRHVPVHRRDGAGLAEPHLGAQVLRAGAVGGEPVLVLQRLGEVPGWGHDVVAGRVRAGDRVDELAQPDVVEEGAPGGIVHERAVAEARRDHPGVAVALDHARMGPLRCREPSFGEPGQDHGPARAQVAA